MGRSISPAPTSTATCFNDRVALLRARKSTGEAVVLATAGAAARDLAIDQAAVYWVADGSVMRVAEGGAASTELLCRPTRLDES